MRKKSLNEFGQLLLARNISLTNAKNLLRSSDPDLFASLSLGTMYRWTTVETLPARAKQALKNFELLTSKRKGRKEFGKGMDREYIRNELRNFKLTCLKLLGAIKKLEKFIEPKR